MGTLAHVLEAEGLATIALSLVRGQIERIHPPRALHCDFPLGRPLGKPNDPSFQRRVLDAAFQLLGYEEGPILKDFPEAISDQGEEPLICPLPPRVDPSLPEPVDEALALRPAYERARSSLERTGVGRVVDAEGVPGAVGAFLRVANGVPWEKAGIPGDPIQAAMDIRAYYEEAALALVDHVPAAHAAESWLCQKTAAGRTLRDAQEAMRKNGVPVSVWGGLLPAAQQDRVDLLLE